MSLRRWRFPGKMLVLDSCCQRKLRFFYVAMALFLVVAATLHNLDLFRKIKEHNISYN